MIQQDIQFFWPLTEQIKLDLDYTPCEKYNKEKLAKSIAGVNVTATNGQYVITGSNGTPIWTTSTTFSSPALIIYPEKTPITVRTKNKPSVLARWVYRILGMKWEREC